LTRDLRPLFDPSSVAIVGASNTPGKWGYWLGNGALLGEDRRTVYLVNRKGGQILGREAYRSLAELPEAPELVVITVPASAFEEAIEEAIEAGSKALVVISAAHASRLRWSGSGRRERCSSGRTAWGSSTPGRIST
jgi:acyl-CoA synthetase (NDP forming)